MAHFLVAALHYLLPFSCHWRPSPPEPLQMHAGLGCRRSQNVAAGCDNEHYVLGPSVNRPFMARMSSILTATLQFPGRRFYTISMHSDADSTQLWMKLTPVRNESLQTTLAAWRLPHQLRVYSCLTFRVFEMEVYLPRTPFARGHNMHQKLHLPSLQKSRKYRYCPIETCWA